MRLSHDMFCADVSIWDFLLKIDMTFDKIIAYKLTKEYPEVKSQKFYLAFLALDILSGRCVSCGNPKIDFYLHIHLNIYRSLLYSVFDLYDQSLIFTINLFTRAYLSKITLEIMLLRILKLI